MSGIFPDWILSEVGGGEVTFVEYYDVTLDADLVVTLESEELDVDLEPEIEVELEEV